MKVSGFTFIRNAVKFDYPIVEAITSVLPLCDEFVVALGNCEDETEAMIRNIDTHKIKIIPTVWNDELRSGGRVLALETDKALAAIDPAADWAFYIQGDEVLHEEYIPVVRKAMEDNLNNKAVEGLLFKYLHFYGSYSYIGDARRFYRHEIRVIRNTGKVAAFRDAQGFRTHNNRKLNVKLIDACIYHYGWVKPPAAQVRKQNYFGRFWHNDAYMSKLRRKNENFNYSNIDSLELFTGSHPAVMQARINTMSWQFNHDTRNKNRSFKARILAALAHQFGLRPGEYRNYRIIQ